MSPSTAPRRKPVVDVTGRLRAKRRREWRRRILIGLAGVVALGLVAGAVWLVQFSQVLASKKVTVHGTTTLTEDRVREVAQVPLGRPLARVGLQPVVDRLTSLEQVASAKARVVWPDTVEITVVERTPVFAAASPDGYRLVDAMGQAYGHQEKAPTGLVVARFPGVLDPHVLAGVAAVVGALPDSLKGATITAPTRDSITLTLPQGPTVVWGSAQESELKARVVTELMKAVKAKVYDVSAPARPTTR